MTFHVYDPILHSPRALTLSVQVGDKLRRVLLAQKVLLQLQELGHQLCRTIDVVLAAA